MADTFATLAIGVAASLLGVLLASLLSLIPALHIYNVAGLALLFTLNNPTIPPEPFALFMLGMVVGYAMLNTLPAVFFSAPDDSMINALLPAQKYLLAGRGYEAVLLTGLGSLGGVLLLLALSPFMSLVLPPVRALVQPHLHWILGLVIVYMIMSEWPISRGRTVGQKFFNAWSQLIAGLITFTLSGLLGIVLLYRSPIAITAAYQNLLPAFVGFFAIPAILQGLLVKARPPLQHRAATLDLTPGLLIRGVSAGSLGGLFAAFFPVITGGVGGFLAAHATAQRDERVFLVSQGANKILYYIGAYLFFFVPGLRLTRGGMASMVSTLYTAVTPDSYWLAIACLAFTGLVAFLTLLAFSRLFISLLPRLDGRIVAGVTLIIALAVVGGFTGVAGLVVAAVATLIGLIPLLWRTRRMHCLGVLLLPVTLNMAGLGNVIAHWLGLI
jgi:putative membrane protein